MNEEMKLAWLEISDMLGEPTREELDVFLRTWQRASQATREALAEQPAQQQEPVISTAHGPWIPSTHPGEEGESYCKRCLLRDKFLGSRQCDPHIVPPEQPAQQEPVAWARNLTDPQPHCVTDLKYMSVADTDSNVQYTPLYTSPPAQHTWVELTDADKQEAFDETQEASGGFWEFADYLEDKLKEKNT